MKVVGLCLARNEVDIIETNLRHHLTTGAVDEVLVIDNGSTDGTLEVLGVLAEDLPITVAHEPGVLHQSDRTTWLARVAASRGADWVLPFDADEFWVGTDVPIRQVLEETPSHVAHLACEVVNFVQSRQVLTAVPGCLATMVMRPDVEGVSPNESWRRLHEGESGFVELVYHPKGVHRATPDLVVKIGNHVNETDGAHPTSRMVCLHAPLRSRSMFIKKLDHGRRVIEEQLGPDKSLHLQRWWQLARNHNFEGEWDSCSFDDHGAITVAGVPHALVPDERLRDVVEAVAPQVSVRLDGVASPIWMLPAPIGAYLLAMDPIPGWFAPLDLRILVELDRLQRAHGITGDLFEIGTFFGKSAILLGYLTQAGGEERLVVCDVFEQRDGLDDETAAQFSASYAAVSDRAFLEQYERFHARPPEVIVGPSSDIDANSRKGTCRLVHVDGSHRYDVVCRDAATARQLLGPGGIVAFDDVSTAHNPGSALAIWELVLSGAFVPICLTDAKLYGTWDGDALDWAGRIDEWVAAQPDVRSEIHTLADWPVRRLVERPVVRPPARHVTLPSIEELDEWFAQRAAEARAAEQQAAAADPERQPSRARLLAHRLAPPIAVDWYRRARYARNRP